MGDLSLHFDHQEFACHCCGKATINGFLVAALEELRTAAGVPVHILSGYRCPAHNAAVGGEPDSHHLLGNAADIQISGKNVKEIYALVRNIPAFIKGGIGIYPRQGFVHVDVRGKKARWGQVNGKYVSIEEALRVNP